MINTQVLPVAQFEAQQVLTLKLFIPQEYDPAPFLFELISEFDVDVKILEASLEVNFWGYRRLKIELHGSNQQFFASLNYLAAHGAKMKLDLDNLEQIYLQEATPATAFSCQNQSNLEAA
jgi:ABC-type methionine transport system ATPase subunit